MSILTIDHISKYYNLDGTNQERALNDVTLEIASGKITAIYGPSGCGKTSLLSIISGLDSQYQGNLYFKNQNMRDFSERDLTYFRKAHIGFVFQNFNLIPHQSVLENVKMPLYVKNMTDKEMIEIAEKELSRVAIARALVNNPEMIVADEPTGSLDSQSQENVLEIFKELAEAGKTVIIVTHNPEVADYADVVIKMKDGEVVETIEK